MINTEFSRNVSEELNAMVVDNLIYEEERDEIYSTFIEKFEVGPTFAEWWVANEMKKYEKYRGLKYRYATGNFVRVEGLSFEQLKAMLEETYADSQRYDPDGEEFMEHVHRYSEGDYYNYHYVAREYLKLRDEKSKTETEEKVRAV